MKLKQILFTATLLVFNLNAMALPFVTYESRSAGAVSANTYVQSNTGMKYAGFFGFDSTIDLVSLEVGEVGISFARKFGNLSIGITPKSLSVISCDSDTILLRTINDFNDVPDAATTRGQKEHGSNFNADVSVDYRFGEFSDWQMSIVQRNTSEQTFTTSAGTTVKIEPQTRAGIAYNGNVITLAVDYDLTRMRRWLPVARKPRCWLPESKWTCRIH